MPWPRFFGFTRDRQHLGLVGGDTRKNEALDLAGLAERPFGIGRGREQQRFDIALGPGIGERCGMKRGAGFRMLRAEAGR